MPKKRFRIPVKDRCEHYKEDGVGYTYKGKNEDGFSLLECPECKKVMVLNGKRLPKNDG